MLRISYSSADCGVRSLMVAYSCNAMRQVCMHGACFTRPEGPCCSPVVLGHISQALVFVQVALRPNLCPRT
jgi:hypothetical protein